MKFNVTLQVDSERKLATILEAISGSARLVGVVPVPEESEPEKERNHGYANGKRNKGISGVDLAVETLRSANRVFTFTEVARVFQDRGFAPNSASPSLTMAVKENRAIALGGGKYCAPGTTIHKGAGETGL